MTTPYAFTSLPTVYLIQKTLRDAMPIIKINGKAFTNIELDSRGLEYLEVTSAAYTTLSINSRWTFGEPPRFWGKIYEIMVLTGSLKEPHHRIIEGYMAWKWGLEKSLPRRHPYYRVPPGK
jgi:hypothetical protein